MEKKQKILNDPVYGFISIPYGILFDLVEHPYFQRLRNVKQVSLTHYVYPGALHTRFHHALGALHLMQQAVASLKGKGVKINKREAEAVMIAILLHDIGHGPFSHTLEKTLIDVHHEELSLLFMQRLNDEFNGRLDLAIRVFTGKYKKHFLHQLVSGQLDMDRLDYLNRDSYFTGVAEGVIGYDRIIKMLNVVNDRLVVEQKGIYSVERFLTSRRIMYWQVYLHKTVVAAEQMLRLILQRARELADTGRAPWAPPSLTYFLNHRITRDDFHQRRNDLLDCFAALDDTDISTAVKAWQQHPDPLLSYLSYGLVNRRLFRLEFANEPFDPEYVDTIRQALARSSLVPRQAAAHLIIQGKETNSAYTLTKEEIMVCTKNGDVVPMSSVSDFGITPRVFTKYFLCYPKEVS
ncbi:HD domain-containing protein [Lewinella sp. JB7]|uniref:HD domain-containing protein n=1 Tax=Lewinella sp. JB7 TaxID=2962887 RepID=UPI0020C945E1|nr:HD domain-containing protein [Lewinella sp. JB7]MCP9237437.1 HD domain-containing protein [Lewinella sp. JB7]